ncbi:hypothetical protein [Sorangium atrum]|uniref:Uncharacterized protein n=1 Tax=Sorangium atrum TaxID=2995308 RepID=A0ABT5BWL3_9BACT|nr:hypothetical protein [Sorangium aterium]MDC0677980.1 hypothetical protein [Sorangium aterium]
MEVEVRVGEIDDAMGSRQRNIDLWEPDTIHFEPREPANCFNFG